MKASVLLVAATETELSRIQIPEGIQVLITGIGIANTAASLAVELHCRKPRMIVHAGIAGSFRSDLPAGTLCEIISDRYSDFGAWAPMGYQGTDANIANPALESTDAIIPFDPTEYINPAPITNLKKARAVTVQSVSGSETSIRQVQLQYQPDIETMEGAVALQLALKCGIPFCGIRAISNPVTPRNRELWNIPLALDALGKYVSELLPRL